MSTNSAIGVVINGKIKAVYCHWDGYVDGVGKMLLENYDQAKTELLVAEGAISSLKKEIGVKHPFNTYSLSDIVHRECTDMTTFYGRDGGDHEVSAELFETADAFLEYYSGEYWYLLGTDGVWYVSEGDMNWKKVSDVLAWETE